MGWYRLSLKLGVRKRSFPQGKPVQGAFFLPVESIPNYPQEWMETLRDRAESILNGRLTWFSHHQFQVGDVPDWFRNPFTGETIADPYLHWTELSDFDLNIGDIKIIWEPSRFDWLTDLARAYRVFGDERYLRKLNQWMNDWSEHNPKNVGPNWKCGQETSVRLMKMLHAAWILGQSDRPTEALSELVFQHLQRVAGNIRYAVAQDNNHGTTEAAALLVLSSWLLKHGKQASDRIRDLEKWRAMAEAIWNERVIHLIGDDGTFSQRSVTYHRVVVDTASFVLFFGKELRCYIPTDLVLHKLQALASWQLKFIIPDMVTVRTWAPMTGRCSRIFTAAVTGTSDHHASLYIGFCMAQGSLRRAHGMRPCSGGPQRVGLLLRSSRSSCLHLRFSTVSSSSCGMVAPSSSCAFLMTGSGRHPVMPFILTCGTTAGTLC